MAMTEKSAGRGRPIKITVSNPTVATVFDCEHISVDYAEGVVKVDLHDQILAPSSTKCHWWVGTLLNPT